MHISNLFKSTRDLFIRRLSNNFSMKETWFYMNLEDTLSYICWKHFYLLKNWMIRLDSINFEMQKQTNAGFVLKLVCVHPWSICKTQNTFSKATKIKQRASSSATRLMQKLFTSALKNLFVESQTYQIGRDLQGNKMCLPSKSLWKLVLIYIPVRKSSSHHTVLAKLSCVWLLLKSPILFM